MGGLWAGRLAVAGVDVAVLDVSPELIDAIRLHGVRIETPRAEDVVAQVPASTDPAEIGPRDVVFVFVKGPHTQSAAAAIGPLLSGSTTVVTLQNGWGNADVLAEFVSTDRLVVGVTYQGATARGLGHLENGGQGPTYVGPCVDGASLDPAAAVAELMTAAGLEAVVTNHVKTDIWRKLIHNASCLAVLAVAALTDLRTCHPLRVSVVADLLGLARSPGRGLPDQVAPLDESDPLPELGQVERDSRAKGTSADDDCVGVLNHSLSGDPQETTCAYAYRQVY